MADPFGAGPSFGAMLVTHQHSLQAPSVSHADLLTHPILASSDLPSAAEIKERIRASQTAQQAALEDLQATRSGLMQDLQSLLAATQSKGDQLTQLPEEIGSVEDALSELCADLQGTQIDSTASYPHSSTMLQSFTEQHALLRQLEAVRDYLSLLARAEQLKSLAIKAEDGDGQSNASAEKEDQNDALNYLAELASLAKRITGMTTDASQDVKAIKFVHAQKMQVFAHLAKRREDRLTNALKESGWPPPPPELQAGGAASAGPNESIESTLLGSSNVRRRWRELMLLQRKSENLSVLRPASARFRSSQQDGTAQRNRSAPGSDDYQPLLAVQCLLKPLLLRFYYHFDSSRPTNRLDKPEWYLAHMLSVLRSNAALFQPISGMVAVLCNNADRKRQELRYDLSAELLHGLLRPLMLKLESSIPLLLQNSQLLSHTIMQVVQFDQDIRSMLTPVDPSMAPIHLADALLSNETVFEAWVQSERTFASDRLNEELESGGAWLVGDEDGLEDASAEGSWTAMAQDGGQSNDGNMKTTRSARAVVALIDGLTARYSALQSVHHQLPFLLIQLSVLQGYAQRLERSLDAFESLSSAFTRAIPGAIAGGAGDGQGVSNSEADMVRGLRGLGRLLKAGLSALFVAAHLSALSSQSFFLLMGVSLASSGEGSKLLGDFRKWEGEEEERELDQASLGELVRRGWRTGGRFASGMRPLATNTASTAGSDGNTHRSANDGERANAEAIPAAGMIDVWAKSRTRFEELGHRAQRGIEKMIISEVLDGMRTYAQRDWDEKDLQVENEDDPFDIPTPSLLPCLSTLSTHLHHLIPSLPRVQANAVYRAIAEGLSTSIVDRVVFAGGAHRFSLRGAERFSQDVQQGWIGVVADVAAQLTAQKAGMADQSGTTAMGARPQAPWGYLVDTATLLSLKDDQDAASDVSTAKPTLQQACRAAFEPTMAGPSWQQVVEMLAIDDRMSLRVAREILRRRDECPW